MAYKLNVKWFSKNGCEEVILSKTRVDFCFGNVKSIVSNNQELLKELQTKRRKLLKRKR